jgi:hypothetical protein
VLVGRVDKDRDDPFTDRLITVNKDASQSVTRLLKEELSDVKPGDTIWLIRPPYVTVVASVPAYRFSLGRVVTVFPEFFLLACAGWLFARFRSRLGRPFDAYEGGEKPSTTYVVPDPDSWGRSSRFIKGKGQEQNQNQGEGNS